VPASRGTDILARVYIGQYMAKRCSEIELKKVGPYYTPNVQTLFALKPCFYAQNSTAAGK